MTDKAGLSPDQPCGKDVAKCFEKHRFSRMLGDLTDSETVKDVTEFVEVGSEISLASDIAATAYKATQTQLGTEAYASGMNVVLRRLGRATGSPAITGALRQAGKRLTPVAAAAGAFTGGYNSSIYLQCLMGLLE